MIDKENMKPFITPSVGDPDTNNLENNTIQSKTVTTSVVTTFTSNNEYLVIE